MSRFYVNKIIWTSKISLDAGSYRKKLIVMGTSKN